MTEAEIEQKLWDTIKSVVTDEYYVQPVVFEDGSTGYGVFRPADRRHTEKKGGRPLNPFSSPSLADCAAWINLNSRGLVK